MQRIKDIEVLRAIAVLYTVVAHRYTLLFWQHPHADRFNHYLSFREGVDIFFVISGFVITRSLWPILKDQKDILRRLQIIRSFWIRRVFRILPSAWFWAILVYTLGLASFSQLLAANLNYMDIYDWRFPIEGTPISHYWSLSLEEQFYLVIPLLFLIKPRALKWTLIGVCIAQMLVRRPVGGSLWFMRSDALLMGVLIAMSLEMPWRQKLEPAFLGSNRICTWVGVLGLLGMLSAFGAANQEKHFWCAQAFVSICAALLVWVASFDKSYIMPECQLKKALVWLGARSYAMYLVHPLCFMLVRVGWARWEPVGTVFDDGYILYFCGSAMALVLLFSELNYRLMEVPLRDLGRRLAA